MRALNPSNPFSPENSPTPLDSDKLISLLLLLRTSPLLPDLQTAFFRCQTCNHTLLVSVSRGKITEPPVCPRDVCSAVPYPFTTAPTLLTARSGRFKRHNEVPAGQTQHMTACLLEHVFIFPNNESNPTSFKFLQMAHAWKEAQKKKKMEAAAASAPVTTSPRAIDDDDQSSDEGS